jgi:hypothetical protein
MYQPVRPKGQTRDSSRTRSGLSNRWSTIFNWPSSSIDPIINLELPLACTDNHLLTVEFTQNHYCTPWPLRQPLLRGRWTLPGYPFSGGTSVRREQPLWAIGSRIRRREGEAQQALIFTVDPVSLFLSTSADTRLFTLPGNARMRGESRQQGLRRKPRRNSQPEADLYVGSSTYRHGYEK